MIIIKKNLYSDVRTLMNYLGIDTDDMIATIYNLQKSHIQKLKFKNCAKALNSVLHKREVLHILLTGFNLDIASEKNRFSPTLQYILKHDEGLYGVDEDLAISLAQLFGSIAVTNYGYLDVHKHGLAAKLDRTPYRVFSDDLVSALIASAASKLAHQNGDKTNYDKKVAQNNEEQI